ncbi:tetratricopeptide repeat protein [Aquimarina sp. 2201CG1-2-11]|uniref:tetratricopeptide repeat-containing sensor histidine kinase n=1 Tax=Aquimarina discodermiae TaxID=3231043 RepID=UPI0034636D2E
MSQPNKSTSLLFSILFILLMVCYVTNAQQEINTTSKIAVNDSLLLETAETYVKKEADREKSFNIGHDILKRTQIFHHKVHANRILSNYHYYKYATDSAIYYAKNAIALIGNKQDSISLRFLSSLYMALSHASRDKNLLKDSKKWALEGIKTSEKIDDSIYMGQHISNLALIERKMGNPKKAIELLKSALKYKEYPNYYASIAICYLDLKNYDQSLFFQKKELDFSKKNNNQRSIAIALLNIGNIYLEKHKDDEALTYFNKSIKISKEYNYPLITLNNMINIGEVFKNKKDFSKAKENYFEVLSIAKKSGYLMQQTYVYQQLKDIALEEKKFEKALTYTEKKNLIQDSINRMQKDNEISKLEVEYETLKKEKEITVLKKDQELKTLELQQQQSQKKIIAYAFGIILIPLIGLLFLYYQKLQAQSELNKKQEEINEQKISSLLKEQELKLIKASIKGQDNERKRIAQELHDSIGGNLAAIKLQLNNKENKEENIHFLSINEQIDDTYEKVRELSHNLIPKKFSENNFCDVLEEYCSNIGNARNFSSSFIAHPRTKIDDLNEQLQIEVFKIIQELITNTIKHAKASCIELQLNLVDNILNILFEDNGIGFSVEKNINGIGFKNIKSRLNKISGTLHIDSMLKRGTIINIEIPNLVTTSNEI